MSSTQAIIDQVRASPKIPAPSQTVFKVLELTRDSDCDIRIVASAVSRDSGLTAQLLREANSALYGFNTPTSNVGDACMRLGLKRVRAAVINQHVVDGLGRTKPEGFDTSRYWQSAFATSVAARDICEDILPRLAAAASTAGLLCDFGIGLMAFGIPQRYASVLRQLRMPGARPIHEIERRELGLTHADVGAAILQDWKLETEIIDAVRQHHFDPLMSAADEAPSKFAAAVAAAATLADIALNGSEMEAVGLLFAHVETLSSNPDALVQKLLDNIVKHIQQTAETLKVELGSIDAIKANFEDLSRDIPDVSARMSFKPMDRSAFE
ncbi:MAG: HDOD domain-containing protein [Phycisphaerales bacterium]|nr:HDOD domain-containing protein [Phycisphaerales bacterium]